jgi:hypothetical protein
MNKEELIEHMFKTLAEVEEQDSNNWDRLLEAGDYQEIDLDKAWHNGYASAISTVRNMLNDK